MNANEPNFFIRSGNDVIQARYDDKQSLQEQKLLNAKTDGDQALVKVVSQNGYLYVESAAHVQHQIDLDLKKEAGATKLQENMYLVVRSLKHNDVR